MRPLDCVVVVASASALAPPPPCQETHLPASPSNPTLYNKLDGHRNQRLRNRTMLPHRCAHRLEDKQTAIGRIGSRKLTKFFGEKFLIKFDPRTTMD
ncbi:hypothetical protein FB566_3252 [Stackebrandtia endophytica]|uniref:Uncharacterized protein n=1 Tax=Stackebrandtia endophytica TaxID=1496996 RepID=A0A543AYU0_9ACTN|nr:hypothetical protein FB566_3252 [Stackebrandtia endophytica]